MKNSQKKQKEIKTRNNDIENAEKLLNVKKSRKQKLYLDEEHFFKALNDAGMGRKELVEKLKDKMPISNPKISKWFSDEKTQSINRLELELLAETLNKSPEWLVGLDDCPLPHKTISQIVDRVQSQKYHEIKSTLQFIDSLGFEIKTENNQCTFNPVGKEPIFIDEQMLVFLVNEIKKLSSSLLDDYYNSDYAMIRHIDNVHENASKNKLEH